MNSQALAIAKKENTNQSRHKYKIGDQVLIASESYERATEGPYKVIRVYPNGNVRISCDGYDEDIDIRRLRPYLSRTNAQSDYFKTYSSKL